MLCPETNGELNKTVNACATIFGVHAALLWENSSRYQQTVEDILSLLGLLRASERKMEKQLKTLGLYRDSIKSPFSLIDF
jgi:hypothetical protein